MGPLPKQRARKSRGSLTCRDAFIAICAFDEKDISPLHALRGAAQNHSPNLEHYTFRVSSNLII